MPARRSRASAGSRQRGSPLRLPLVATRGRPKPTASSWCNGEAGNITPKAALPGATPAKGWRWPGRNRSSTIGAAGCCSWSLSGSDSSTRGAMASRSATSRARGLAGRCLRWRNRATAAGLPAATSSWKPPTPCRAKIPPAASRARAAASGSPPPSSAPCHCNWGPQAGQPIVSAWKRRSVGSSNSRWQRAHRRKPARLVWARA